MNLGYNRKPLPPIVPRHLVEVKVEEKTPEPERDYIFVASSVSGHDILRATSVVTGVSLDDLRSSRRSDALARARQMFFFLCRVHTLLSLPQIGMIVPRDHSTVLHGINIVWANLHRCEDYLEKIEKIVGRNSSDRNISQLKMRSLKGKPFPVKSCRVQDFDHWARSTSVQGLTQLGFITESAVA